MKQKILLASSSFYRCPQISDDTIKKLLRDFQIIKNPHNRRMSSEELVKYGKSCVGIIAGLEEFTSDTLINLPKLRCISRDGVGVDNINLKTANKLGISVLNTPDANTEAVAELTIGLLVSLLRHIPQHNVATHNGKWDQRHGRLLQSLTIGIIGVGRIGKRVIELLQPYGCQIVCNDIVPDLKWMKSKKITHITKKHLYRICDIISLHPSYLSTNKYLISNPAFSQMKKGVIILNLSRGQIIKEIDLVANLKSGQVAAAAIDVFESEPYSGALTKMQNVILTPHIGGSTYESRYKMQSQAINNLVSYLSK